MGSVAAVLFVVSSGCWKIIIFARQQGGCFRTISSHGFRVVVVSSAVTRRFPLQTLKPQKIQRRKKVTQKLLFGLPAKASQKLLKSDSTATKTVTKATFEFESLLRNF